MRDFRLFQPLAKRKRVVKRVYRLDDDFGEYIRDTSETTLKRGNFLNSSMYLTQYSNKYIETHKHLYRCKQLLFGKWTIDKLNIPLYQLIIIVMTIQLSIQRITRINEMYVLAYRSNALLTHIFASFIIGMPMFAYFMFMGHYSKKCYIRYWQTTPLFKGVAFTIIIILIIESSADIMTCSIAMLYVLALIQHGVGWKTCYWGTEINQECITRNQTFYNNITKRNYLYTITDLPSHIYYEKYILDNYLLLALFITTFVLFLGLLLFKKIKVLLCIINACIFVTILCPVLFLSHYYMIGRHWEYKPFRKNEPANQLEICLRFICEIVAQSLPHCYVTYTARLRKSVKLNSFLYPILIYTSVFLCDLITQIWLSVNLHTFAKIHRFENCDFDHLSEIQGNTLFFVIILDVLYSAANSKYSIAFIYLIILAYWCLVSVLFSTFSIVETILDAYIHLRKYKLGFYSTVAALIFGVSLLRYFKLLFISETIALINLKYIIILLVAINLALYSNMRFSKDYHFEFGHNINGSWLIVFKLIKILCIVCAITTTVIFIDESLLRVHFTAIIKTQFFLIIGILTIFIFALWAILANEHGKSETIAMPEPEWGPGNPILKSLRRQFRQNSLALRQTFACNHHCLQNSVALKQEITIWKNVTEYLDRKFENAL